MMRAKLLIVLQLAVIDASQAAQQQYCQSSLRQDCFSGNGVSIAIVDSGVDFSHPALMNNFGDLLSIFDDGYLYTSSHGTHVAGIAAASCSNGVAFRGVACNSRIVSIRAINDNSTSYSSLLGIEAAADNDSVSVINVSMNLSSGAKISEEEKSRQVFRKIGDKDKIAVFSGGNGSGELSWPATIVTDPIIDGKAVAVVSVDKSGNLSSFSRQCGTYAEYCLAAEGEDVLSTMPEGEYAFKSGTSMAAPKISGFFAQLIEAFPFLSSNDLVKIALGTAEHADHPDEFVGHGRVSYEKAFSPIGNMEIPLDKERINSLPINDDIELLEDRIFNSAISIQTNLPDLVAIDTYGRAFSMKQDDSRLNIKNFNLSDLGLYRKLRKIVDTGSTKTLSFFETSLLGTSVESSFIRIKFNSAKNPIVNDINAMHEVAYSVNNFRLQDANSINLSFFAESNNYNAELYIEKSQNKLSESDKLTAAGIKISNEKTSAEVQFGKLSEINSLLGNSGGKYLHVRTPSVTKFVQAKINKNLKKNIKTELFLSLGTTGDVNPKNSLVESISDLKTISYGVSAEFYPDILKKDSFSVALLTPHYAYSGSTTIRYPIKSGNGSFDIKREKQELRTKPMIIGSIEYETYPEILNGGSIGGTFLKSMKGDWSTLLFYTFNI